MTALRQTAFASPLTLTNFTWTVSELGVVTIPALRAWWEADSGFAARNGGAWADRAGGVRADVLNLLPPVLEVASGLTRLRFGYDGAAGFSGVDRGAMRPRSDRALLAVSGFTVVSVQRVATVASGESATLGGYVWSSRGVSGSQTPGLNISGATGQPVFRAGGQSLENPGFDLRDGAPHIVRCSYNAAATQITVAVDRARASGTRSDAATAMDGTIPGMLAPLIGGFLNTDIPGVLSTPFYGQIYALLAFAAVLTAPQIVAVENYLAAKYNVTLV